MNAFRTLLLAAAVLAPLAATAQAPAPGSLRSYIVQGGVELVDESSGRSVALLPGRVFSHGFSVRTSASGKASFYLSNGSSIVLGPNSSLTVARFEQETFSPSLGSFHSLAADPSKSSVLLNLNLGSISGKVRQLQPLSTFHINTPLGQVTVHGTTFEVAIERDMNGVLVAKVTNLDGGVSFVPLSGALSEVPVGSVISVRMDQDAVAGGELAVIFDSRAVSAETAAAIFSEIEAVARGNGLNAGVGTIPVFIPVKVDPSVVSPEGGSGEP